jgi:competence/damage-inducible protein CinA-like protein
MMNAEIVSIGTELLLGEIVDTNAAHIARQLRTVGLDLFFKTTVGDNETRCADVIDQALNRADVVITTGGVGPTVDDITREAVARAASLQLEFRPELMKQIEERFSRWRSEMSENHRRQAFVPKGAIAIENPVGTAPCFIAETERGVVISLPGVPREMEYLLEHSVLPYLRQRFDLHASIVNRILRTAGLGESRIDTILSDMLTAKNPTIGLAAHPGQTDVRITAKADSEEEAYRLIAPVEAEVRRRLGPIIYGTGKESVEEVLLQRLAKVRLTLAAAESGTGGRLTSRLSTAAGAETAFERGFVANDAAALAATLGVALENESKPELNWLAGRLAADLASSPDGAAAGHRLGLVVLALPHHGGDAATSARGVVIALHTPEGVVTNTLGYAGHAAHAAVWATTYALEMTRRWVLEHWT